LPKINLKVPTNPIEVLQGESIKSNAEGADFKAVIIANVALFQKLAQMYYEGVEKQVIRKPAWVVFFKCRTIAQSKPVGVRLPEAGQGLGPTYWSNFRNFAQIPKCSVHKITDCLDITVTSVAPNDLAAVKKRYDDNGEMQEG
jgi:hypothetical protein